MERKLRALNFCYSDSFLQTEKVWQQEVCGYFSMVLSVKHIWYGAVPSRR